MRWTEEQHAFMRAFIPGHTTKEILDEFEKTFGIRLTLAQVKSYRGNHHINSGTPHHPGYGLPTKKYPKEVHEYILAHYYGCGPTEMSEKLNQMFGTSYTPKNLKCFYAKMHLDSGERGHFPPGHIPPNKGKKGMQMHPNAVKTQFKKGHTPANKMAIGTVWRKDDGYLWRKIGEGCRDWKQEHRIIWEEAYGPIPKGGILIFLDGDRENVKLENLALIDKSINAIMNKKGLRSDDPELTRVGIQLATLQHALKKKEAGK